MLSKNLYLIFITVSFKLFFGMIEQTQINRVLSNKAGILHKDRKITVFLDEIPYFNELKEKKIMGKSILDFINIELSECKNHKLIFKVKLNE